MTTRVILLTTLLLASLSAGWCASAYEPPVISVPMVRKAPVIDGKVDPAEWAQAAVLSDFVTLGGEKLPALHTTVYLEYDAANFYLAAVCSDPNAANLKTVADKRDGPVLDDDSIQVAIDTVGRRKDVALLAVNAANVQYDSWNGDVSQSFKWQSATSRGPDGWSVELAVPFSRGIGPAVGDSWLINVARNAPGAGEFSSWAPVVKSLLETDRLGPLTFSGPAFRVGLRSLGDWGWARTWGRWKSLRGRDAERERASGRFGQTQRSGGERRPQRRDHGEDNGPRRAYRNRGVLPGPADGHSTVTFA